MSKNSGNRLLIVLFLIALFSSSNLFAQTDLLTSQDLTNFRVETLSDADLLNLYQRGTAAGYTVDEILALAKEKGLPSDQINLLQNRLSTINLTPNSKRVPATKENDEQTKRFDTTLGKIPVKKVRPEETIFGSDFFSLSSTTFEPNLRIPPPPNYMLGPDDHLLISVFGLSEREYDLKINELGEIYIPNVGPLVVSGLTLEQATDKIKNKLASTIYTAIRTGQTKVQVTLGKIRSIRVTVIGQAKRPGTYTVSSLTTLYNILYQCGGPGDMGTYRNIEIIRGKEKRKADLYDFLVYGDQKDNILLQEGDIVRIPYYENRVTISGNIKNPGKFELVNGETFSTLLEYSGGFNDSAYRGSVTVTRITDSLKKIIDLPSSQFSTFETRGSDSYVISKLRDDFINRVFITGAVNRPGPYELTPQLTIEQLITKAGGTTPDAYFNRALIYRYLPNNLPSIESVNLDSVLRFGQKFQLQKNDSLVINSIFFYRDKSTVSTSGELRDPKEILWRDHITLKDVLFASGGLTEAGDSSNIEISRRIRNANVEDPDHTESAVIRVNLSQNPYQDVTLQPYDLVIVRKRPGYVDQRAVLVEGEILRPGRYTLEKSGTTIRDIIMKVGGFKASADSASLTIRRFTNTGLSQEERSNIIQRILNINSDSLDKNPLLKKELLKSSVIINVNLKSAIDNPSGSDNLPLEDGDVLTVARSSNLVSVSGEVYNPTLVAFKPNQNLKYYVQQAGNFMPGARKSKSFVISPNGNIKSVKQFLFFRSYPKVEQRSEVFVPQADRSNRNRIGTTEWAVIVSALSIVANVIVNLTK
ncbi:MAG: SLBB domain-containing protein [Chitinophagaceae bacterium]|nr:SLBB domain-containing protein [Chitinophagaceae bacterium]